MAKAWHGGPEEAVPPAPCRRDSVSKRKTRAAAGVTRLRSPRHRAAAAADSSSFRRMK